MNVGLGIAADGGGGFSCGCGVKGGLGYLAEVTTQAREFIELGRKRPVEVNHVGDGNVERPVESGKLAEVSLDVADAARLVGLPLGRLVVQGLGRLDASDVRATGGEHAGQIPMAAAGRE
jgi:hypothetical protein